MTYAAKFGLLALMSAGAAVYTDVWALLWLAVDFALAALASRHADPALFGKRPDGGRSARSTGVMLPYLLLTWAVWHLSRWISREPAFAEVRPGLWIGRRLTGGEAAPANAVLDLTCEFAEAARHRGPGYLTHPILDAHAPPDSDALVATFERLSWPAEPLYVHCAQGHGRTATVTAALLIWSGICPDAEAALAEIAAVRPDARPNAAQRRWLARFDRRAGGSAGG